jgi:integrase
MRHDDPRGPYGGAPVQVRYRSAEAVHGSGPKTVRNIRAMIHRALVDAVAWKYIADNPASNIKPPKHPRERRTVWKPDQIQTFLMSVQQYRFAALFLLELTTGIRRGQICGPKRSAVDVDTGEITRRGGGRRPGTALTGPTVAFGGRGPRVGPARR